MHWIYSFCNLVRHGMLSLEKHGVKLVRMKTGTGFLRWANNMLMMYEGNITPVSKISSHVMTAMGGNNTVQGIFGPVQHMHQSSPQYWLEMGVSVLGFPLLDSLTWIWGASSTCSKLGQAGFKEVVLPQNFVTSTQFTFAFSLKLSVLTTLALFFRKVSSPAQWEQWTMIFLFCGC